MKYVLIQDRGRWEKIELDKFIKDYNITPKHTGDKFYMLQSNGRNYIISDYPNPACMFYEGRIRYIIYKGNSRTIINGIEIPPCDLIEEEQVCGSYEDALKLIDEIEKQYAGKIIYIDCPDGRRINF